MHLSSWKHFTAEGKDDSAIYRLLPFVSRNVEVDDMHLLAPLYHPGALLYTAPLFLKDRRRVCVCVCV